MALKLDLDNKFALVTGVTSGIGQGIAGMLAEAGCKVMGCGRSDPSEEGAKNFLSITAKAGKEGTYVKADVKYEDDIKNLVNATEKAFGKLDILVSNAGINRFLGAESCSVEQWEENIRLNLRSHWLISKFSKALLDKSGMGVILLMTSNHAFSTIPGSFPYNMAKTAITGLVRSLALEWGPSIRTVGIAPGFIETPANDSWFQSFPDPGKERQKIINIHPVKRLGTPEEVGALCVYLSSPYASFISGCTYLLDGGRSAVMMDEY